jgi:hypothetical protein
MIRRGKYIEFKKRKGSKEVCTERKRVKGRDKTLNVGGKGERLCGLMYA